MKNNKKALTMAEVLIVLSLLGVVAVITIPSAIIEHRKNVARVRVKRAMAYYEATFKKIVVDNNLMTDSKVDSVIDTCVKKQKYFKVVEIMDNPEPNDCVFRTAENFWWNVQDIKNPYVSMSQNGLNEESKRFQFSGHVKNGVIYINDLQYEKKLKDANKANKYDEIEKMYNFINQKN